MADKREWEAAIQREIDRVEAVADPVVADLAKSIMETINNFSSDPPISWNHAHAALGLFVAVVGQHLGSSLAQELAAKPGPLTISERELGPLTAPPLDLGPLNKPE